VGDNAPVVCGGKTGNCPPPVVYPPGPLGASWFNYMLLKFLSDGLQLSPFFGGTTSERVEFHQLINLGQRKTEN